MSSDRICCQAKSPGLERGSRSNVRRLTWLATAALEKHEPHIGSDAHSMWAPGRVRSGKVHILSTSCAVFMT